MVRMKREMVSLLGRFIQLRARCGLKVALSCRLSRLCKLFPATCQPTTGLAGSIWAPLGRTAGVRPSSLLLTRISVLTGRGSVSLSSFGGEGQGEEVAVLSQHARYIGAATRWNVVT